MCPWKNWVLLNDCLVITRVCFGWGTQQMTPKRLEGIIQWCRSWIMASWNDIHWSSFDRTFILELWNGEHLKRTDTWQWIGILFVSWWICALILCFHRWRIQSSETIFRHLCRCELCKRPLQIGLRWSRQGKKRDIEKNKTNYDLGSQQIAAAVAAAGNKRLTYWSEELERNLFFSSPHLFWSFQLFFFFIWQHLWRYLWSEAQWSRWWEESIVEEKSWYWEKFACQIWLRHLWTNASRRWPAKSRYFSSLLFVWGRQKKQMRTTPSSNDHLFEFEFKRQAN